MAGSSGRSFMSRIVRSRQFFRLGVGLCVLMAGVRVAVAEAPAAKLVIQSALYGDLANEKTVDVTKKVAGMVKEDNLQVKASADKFGDPAPGVAKQLRVGYTV